MSIPTSCKIENCNRLGQLVAGKRYFTKGYCKSHYRRHLLGQDVNTTTRHDKRPVIIEGDIAKVPLGHDAYQGYSIIDAEDVGKIEGLNFYSDGNGYPVTTTTGKRTLLHHIIAGRPEKGFYTDHINGDRSDNRKSNLRVVTMLENNMNRAKNSNGKSKYKGVFMSQGVWFSSLSINGKVYRNRHKTELDAAKAYDRLAAEHFGEFARLNNGGVS